MKNMWSILINNVQYDKLPRSHGAAWQAVLSTIPGSSSHWTCLRKAGHNNAPHKGGQSQPSPEIKIASPCPLRLCSDPPTFLTFSLKSSGHVGSSRIEIELLEGTWGNSGLARRRVISRFMIFYLSCLLLVFSLWFGLLDLFFPRA